MKYIKAFQTHTSYLNYFAENGVAHPNTSYCINDNVVHYDNETFKFDYLTFEALADGTFTFTMTAKLSTACVPSISYSTDNGETWTTTENIDETEVVVTTPTITQGNKVLWKSESVQFCTNTDPYTGSNIGYGSFSSTARYNVSGNIMSLLYGEDFAEETTFPQLITNGAYAGAFSNLFGRRTNFLVSAKNLVLPSTTLASYCYYGMFSNCTSLTTAPVLPATTLANNCYDYMFNNCSSLTTAPVLPATTLADYCYNYMFSGCTSLTIAPELPATTLAENCYRYMFRSCTGLTKTPPLPATTLAPYCYGDMFAFCHNLTTVSVLPATTLQSYCYDSMFQGCIGLRTVPSNILPATTLASSCYREMFYGCTNLTTAPVLPATTLAESCYTYMFQGCTSLTTAPDLPATTLASSCYAFMFDGCTRLTAVPTELPATTLEQNCYGYMFRGCTSLTTAPVLPATTLVSNCYQNMFYGCSTLNYIKAMFTTTPTTSYTPAWVSNVAATGTFVKNVNATWNTTGNSGIPTGWTVQTAAS